MTVSRAADRWLSQIRTDVRVGLLGAAVCLAFFAGVIVSIVDDQLKHQRAIPASFQRSIAAASPRPIRAEALSCRKLARYRYRCEGAVQKGPGGLATYSYLLSLLSSGGRCWIGNLERNGSRATLPRTLRGCVPR